MTKEKPRTGFTTSGRLSRSEIPRVGVVRLERGEDLMERCLQNLPSTCFIVPTVLSPSLGMGRVEKPPEVLNLKRAFLSEVVKPGNGVLELQWRWLPVWGKLGCCGAGRGEASGRQEQSEGTCSSGGLAAWPPCPW